MKGRLLVLTYREIGYEDQTATTEQEDNKITTIHQNIYEKLKNLGDLYEYSIETEKGINIKIAYKIPENYKGFNDKIIKTEEVLSKIITKEVNTGIEKITLKSSKVLPIKRYNKKKFN